MKIYRIFVVLTLLVSTQVHAGLLRNLDNMLEVIPIASRLSAQYHLSIQQKWKMRNIVRQSVPEAAIYILQLLENRQELLAMPKGEEGYDPALVARIAQSQGELISQFIIWKEDLKNQLREELNNDQQQFIDDFIEQAVSSRLSIVLQKNHQ